MKVVILVVFIVSFNACNSQSCLDSIDVREGGGWTGYETIYFCPSYTFKYGGDTSIKWNVLNNPIDINQVYSIIEPVKKNVESYIDFYSGLKLGEEIEFVDVQVVYHDSIDKFDRQSLKKNECLCKAKYFFTYRFFINDEMAYNFNVSLNDSLEIISDILLPRKVNCGNIIEYISSCNVIEFLINEYPELVIDYYTIEYRKDSDKLYWVIYEDSQECMLNSIRVFLISITDLSDTQIEYQNVHCSD